MPQTKLNATFVVLDANQKATPIELSPSLYQEIDEKFDGFRGCSLVSEYTFDADWPTWEMHPHGDEILYLLAGTACLYLYEDGVESQLELSQLGSFVKIPQGVWHTAKVDSSCTILFVTPGEGTQQSADPRSLTT